MRAAALALVLVACGPHAHEAEPIDIEELRPPTRQFGPPTISRAVLEEVLSRGPGRFFERMPVRPVRTGSKFVGYEIVELYGNAVPHPDGLRPGDVVLAVNGHPVARPEQFMSLWQQVKSAAEIRVDLLRKGEKRVVAYRIR